MCREIQRVKILFKNFRIKATKGNKSRGCDGFAASPIRIKATNGKKSRGCDGFEANPITIVISCLVKLIEDQTNLLRKFGIPAGLIREDKALDLKTEKGECSVVFSSLESLSR